MMHGLGQGLAGVRFRIEETQHNALEDSERITPVLQRALVKIHKANAVTNAMRNKIGVEYSLSASVAEQSETDESLTIIEAASQILSISEILVEKLNELEGKL